MPEDRRIIEEIGGLLDKWSAKNKKKKQTEQTRMGLESKLGNPNSVLNHRENKMLDKMMKTDEGSSAGLEGSSLGER